MANRGIHADEGQQAARAAPPPPDARGATPVANQATGVSVMRHMSTAIGLLEKAGASHAGPAASAAAGLASNLHEVPPYPIRRHA